MGMVVVVRQCQGLEERSFDDGREEGKEGESPSLNYFECMGCEKINLLKSGWLKLPASISNMDD